MYIDIMMNFGSLTRSLLYMIWNFLSHSMQWSFSADEPCDCVHVQCFRDCVRFEVFTAVLLKMWHCVIWWVASNVSKQHSAFIFTLKIRALCSFETLGNTRCCIITSQKTWSFRDCVCIVGQCATWHGYSHCTCYPHPNTSVSLKLPAGTSG